MAADRAQVDVDGGVQVQVHVSVTMLVLALVLVLAACGDGTPTPPIDRPATAAHRAAADPAEGVATDLDGTAPAFSDALLAELTGDDVAARAAFERVLAASDAPPPLAARSALHLAQMEARDGKSRHALDLMARASALAPSDETVEAGINQLKDDIVAASGAGDIRGPRIGIALPGVDDKIATAFAAAERTLAKVHQMRPRIVLETMSSSISAKQDATETAVAQYRAIADAGGLAGIAADYRIGSLYHDLALGLLFWPLPPELDPGAAAGLRRSLRASALGSIKRAVTAYRASLARPSLADAELWRLAADTDLRGALDILAMLGGA
jgi:hypothetical protein